MNERMPILQDYLTEGALAGYLLRDLRRLPQNWETLEGAGVECIAALYEAFTESEGVDPIEAYDDTGDNLDVMFAIMDASTEDILGAGMAWHVEVTAEDVPGKHRTIDVDFVAKGPAALVAAIQTLTDFDAYAVDPAEPWQTYTFNRR